MSGYVKECIVCKRTFTTISIKGSMYELTCTACHTAKKRTAGEKNVFIKMNNAVLSIETRLDKLEASQEMIPMVIGAEVSSAMLDLNSLTGLDIKGLITAELRITQEALIASQQKTMVLYQKKLQAQIVTLNNKIIKIIQEMKE
tara:strand:- start:1595 stop:2026 length:432 start_codon:yes stop_codon:yes gene_type:complete